MYQLHEGLFPVPANWKDETVNVFTAPDDAGTNLVITRVDIPAGISTSEFYEQSAQQFSSQLPEYKELFKEIIEIQTQDALAIHYQWKSPEGPMHQLAVLFISTALPQMLVFTFTSNQALADSQRDHFLKLVTGFKQNNQ